MVAVRADRIVAHRTRRPNIVRQFQYPTSPEGVSSDGHLRHVDGTTMLDVGTDARQLPSPLADLAARLPERRPVGMARTLYTDHWLFPGRRPDRPADSATLMRRLNALGIYARSNRNAAMLQLAAELPPSSSLTYSESIPAPRQNGCTKPTATGPPTPQTAVDESLQRTENGVGSVARLRRSSMINLTVLRPAARTPRILAAAFALGLLAFAADAFDPAATAGQVFTALTSSGLAWGLAAFLAGRRAADRRSAVHGATVLLISATLVYYLLILGGEPTLERRVSGRRIVGGPVRAALFGDHDRSMAHGIAHRGTNAGPARPPDSNHSDAGLGAGRGDRMRTIVWPRLARDRCGATLGPAGGSS